MGLMGGLRGFREVEANEMDYSYRSVIYPPLERVTERGLLTEVSFLGALGPQKRDIPQNTLPKFVLSELVVEEAAQLLECKVLSKSEAQKEVQITKAQYVPYAKPEKKLSGITFNDNFGLNPFGDISDLSVDWD